jgi:hypothetical protein
MKQLSQTPEAAAFVLGVPLAKVHERVGTRFRRREARPRCGLSHGLRNVGAEKTSSLSSPSVGGNPA